MKDILLRGNSIDGGIRVFAAVTTNLVNEAQKIHKTYPVATAALGRVLTAAVLMGASLKNDTDSITIQVKGDGELGNIVAVTDKNSAVRGYVSNPYVHRPLNDKGKLDVGGAVGSGYLNIIRDLSMKEPYIGQVPLVSGEIADDLTYYFAKSEQLPTSVGLGVLVDTDNSVLAAGGFLLQLMPEASEETAEKLEEIIKDIEPVTTMIRNGMTAEDIIFRITDGFSMLIDNNAVEPVYQCKCSKERMEKALISIGKDELRSIIDEQGEAELTCQFCNNSYLFDRDSLENLIKLAK